MSDGGVGFSPANRHRPSSLLRLERSAVSHATLERAPDDAIDHGLRVRLVLVTLATVRGNDLSVGRAKPPTPPLVRALIGISVGVFKFQGVGAVLCVEQSR